MFSPVAVTITSASSSSPEASAIPSSVKVSMSSVTIEASPRWIALNRSPSGTRQTRWSHGSYFGLKWGSVGKPGGSLRATPLRTNAFTHLGRRRLNWKKSWVRSTFFQRTIG